MLEEHWLLESFVFGRLGARPFADYQLKSVGQVVTRPCDDGTRSFMQGCLEPFGNLAVY